MLIHILFNEYFIIVEIIRLNPMLILMSYLLFVCCYKFLMCAETQIHYQIWITKPATIISKDSMHCFGISKIPKFLFIASRVLVPLSIFCCISILAWFYCKKKMGLGKSHNSNTTYAFFRILLDYEMPTQKFLSKNSTLEQRLEDQYGV